MKKRICLILALLFCTALLIPAMTQAAGEQTSAGKITTVSTGLNVRSGPGTGYTIKTSLRRNTYVHLLSRSGNWWYVEYANRAYGYCSADYITAIPSVSAKVSTAGGNLNVRSGPGTGYAIWTSLSNGTALVILETSGNWYKVLYYGTQTGWVSKTYVTAETDTNLRAVTLSVPLYLQRDSRWSSTVLGRSGKTIANIGCTTCAMAMLESTIGPAVNPAQMASRLTYSSSGDLYWPANYTAYTGKDYLQKVYDSLQEGIPVMIGGKTAAGSQHWVVITGFTGGDLTAENFRINDPGSATRTSLAEFQARFPVFYKIMLRR